MMLEQAVRILTEAAIGWSPRGLHIGDVPVYRAEHTQKRFWVHRARANLGVDGLLQDAAVRGPEFGQREYQLLERHFLGCRRFATRNRFERTQTRDH